MSARRPCRDGVRATQAGYNYDETVSTLRYANRAKNIKNKPKINEDPKDAMLREFQDEIARLKAGGQAALDEAMTKQGKAARHALRLSRAVAAAKAESLTEALDEEHAKRGREAQLSQQLDEERARVRVLARQHAEARQTIASLEATILAPLPPEAVAAAAGKLSYDEQG